MTRATRRDAVKLLVDGQKALARMEANGVKVNEAFLDAQLKATADRIGDLEAAMMKDVVWKEMQKRYGNRANVDSTKQVATVLFGPMGFKPDETKRTAKTGQLSMTEEALAHIDHPFMTLYRERKKIDKLRRTYLVGLKRETVNGFVHPSYKLNTAMSYRSACSEPNFQNIPVRNKKLSEFIRKCYMARGDNTRMVDVDYSGIETKVSTAYHFDPEWTRYMKDPHSDMHRDMAMKCFHLAEDQVNKMTRYVAKNMYVFPQFYGSYYLDCARAMWYAIDKLGLTTADGKPLKEHLAAKGIKALGACSDRSEPVRGTFEYHIKEVEKWYWNVKYPVFAKWKKDLYQQYLRTGYVDMHTGFRAEGSFRRNQVLNLPIQGPAFHCELQAVIWIQEELDRRKMFRSLIVGQVHDAIVGDVHDNELEDYLKICKRVMTVKVPQAWKWINVPLSVEAEAAPAGATWHEKTAMEIAA